MGMQVEKKIGDTTIVISNIGLISGWEIKSISVGSQDVYWRKGEYESKEEAEKAALEIAESSKD